ncbi:alpha-xylosidase [Solwaraspora sp. WMMA2080]|uniref:alpha-xylosidase n=1 Tax=unclassified Solwaraspora TaxID=2627926 RepID=UPI00248CD090|nr:MULTISPECIES: alpha-xylosidase [unclassified Solwaraspora]WBB95103.1 alpha-xylosidase [Solwaraspora sp. WMMA2059]WBC21013.1 alpha-xylosidase [Solwaraspora sp. WMMA2080]
MKFSNGYWRMRDGVRPLYPAQVHDVEVEPSALTVYAPTRRITGRGDTLNQPLLTVRCTSPAPDVISVQVGHFLGRRRRHPDFALAIEPDTDVQVTDEAEYASITSGELTARFARGDSWRLEFVAAGRVLTGSGYKSMAALDTDDGSYVREQLSLGVGETVYGLGERFGPLVRNGQVVDIWHEDGGTSSEQAYKNVPFYLTTGGYGVFVNHPGLVSFEVGSEVVSRVSFSVAGQSLEYLVIYGPTPREILRKYTALTGRPALPPAWSFGLWLSTSFTTSYDEQTVSSFIDTMAELELPLSVFHFDCFWMREFHWSNFEWDPQVFPEPELMLERLRKRDLKICVWINPYIAQRSALFAEGAARGYLVRTADGDVWQCDLWQAGMGLVDFTNPDARRWYADKLRALLDMGVDAFKTDFGERIPTDVVWHDGADPERMHNYYTHLYNRTVFDLLREHRGEGEAVLFARSATAGGQQFPVHWGGDCESTFESMAESLRGGLSLAMSGFGFWSHDIGGFEGRPAPEVFKRWIPFGLLSSHSRLHGSQTYRVPWTFDEEAVDVLRVFTRLKARLMPYLFGQAVLAHRDGIPVMRPLVADFPDDPAVTHLERQYLLGDSLLVAPAFRADGQVDFYLPAGTWTHLQTGEEVTGPGWVRRTVGFDQVPVLVRPGTVLPLGANADRPDYPYVDGVTLAVYQLADGQQVQVSVPALDGSEAARFVVARHGTAVTADRVAGPALPWRVQLVGHGEVREVAADISRWQGELTDR